MDLWQFLLGAAVASGGFIVQRAIKKSHAHEEVDLKSRMLDLRDKMSKQGISFEQLDDFEDQLLSRRTALRKVEDDVLVELAEKEITSAAEIEAQVRRRLGSFDSADMTQGEMNSAQGAELRRAEALMDEAYHNLRGMVSAEQSALLHRAQQSWLRYRDRQGDFAAAQYEGGSMQPLIRLSEMTEVTVDRTVRLRLEIEHLEYLNAPP